MDSVWVVLKLQGGKVDELSNEAAQNLMRLDQARRATDEEIEKADEINAKILYGAAGEKPKAKKKSAKDKSKKR